MDLTVRLFANFRDGRFKQEQRAYQPGTSVGQIADGLSIPRAEVGVLLVNGRHAEFEQVPVEGDVVSIFPKVGGG